MGSSARQNPVSTPETFRQVDPRREILERLLDPILTLSETATILGVCPTTVRRHTNSGALKCFRTPGNQRRFRLSHLLDFLAAAERPRLPGYDRDLLALAQEMVNGRLCRGGDSS